MKIAWIALTIVSLAVASLVQEAESHDHRSEEAMKADKILVLDVYDENFEENKTRIYSVSNTNGWASAERHSQGRS